MEKIIFVLAHYAALLTFVMSAWGVGDFLFKKLLHRADGTDAMRNPISIVLGIGIFIVALQLLGITGKLNKTLILILLLIGNLLALTSLFTRLEFNKAREIISKLSSFSQEQKILLLILLITSLPLLIKPIRPPLSWDEVMYHLPHAHQWASNGKLTVNAWLRYPWFPYNYELLYAASMVLFDDVMPHLLHSLAGWLTAWLVFKLACQYFSFITATLATIIWLFVTKEHYSDAYIDLAVSMFIFSAFICFYFWLQKPENKVLLVMAAFLIGLAIGSKYQALMFLPFFGIALLWKDKRPSTIFMAILFLIIPCIYWYARNYILTGDPVNPVGGKLFGFSDWSYADFERQFKAFTPEKRGWPSWLLIPAIIIIFDKKFRAKAVSKYLFLFGLSSTIIWVFVSHYPRYLLPVLPALSLLAGAGWLYIVSKINFIHVLLSHKKFKVILTSFIILLLLLDSSVRTISATKYIAPDEETRERILLNKISGYKAIMFLNKYYPAKTYQFGLEDSIYYFNSEVWGDHFGPGRYADFSNLSARDLHFKLQVLGFKNLIINDSKWKKLKAKPNFNCFFNEVYQDNVFKTNDRTNVVLYRINEKPVCS